MKNLLGSYPSVINYLVSAIFIAMSIALIWSGPQNWSIVPLLVLFAILFYKKKGKKEVSRLGERLIFPFLGFNFLVQFIQSWVNRGEAFDLWLNGLLVASCVWFTCYKFVVEPKKMAAANQEESDNQ